jgi:hypothetical protein
MVVAFSALLISTVSIFVAQQSNQSMERLVRAGSWPFLQLASGNASDDGARELAFGVENVGTGPARVYTYTVEVDGETLPSTGHMLTNVLRACCDEAFRAAVAESSEIEVFGSEMSSPVAQRFLAPNAAIIAMRWPRTEQNAAVWAALDQARQRGRIVTSICYCSVFDECWVARSNAFPPEEITSCEQPAQSSAAP